MNEQVLTFKALKKEFQSIKFKNNGKVDKKLRKERNKKLSRYNKLNQWIRDKINIKNVPMTSIEIFEYGIIDQKNLEKDQQFLKLEKNLKISELFKSRTLKVFTAGKDFNKARIKKYEWIDAHDVDTRLIIGYFQKAFESPTLYLVLYDSKRRESHCFPIKLEKETLANYQNLCLEFLGFTPEELGDDQKGKGKKNKRKDKFSLAKNNILYKFDSQKTKYIFPKQGNKVLKLPVLYVNKKELAEQEYAAETENIIYNPGSIFEVPPPELNVKTVKHIAKTYQISYEKIQDKKYHRFAVTGAKGYFSFNTKYQFYFPQIDEDDEETIKKVEMGFTVNQKKKKKKDSFQYQIDKFQNKNFVIHFNKSKDYESFDVEGNVVTIKMSKDHPIGVIHFSHKYNNSRIEEHFYAIHTKDKQKFDPEKLLTEKQTTSLNKLVIKPELKTKKLPHKSFSKASHLLGYFSPQVEKFSLVHIYNHTPVLIKPKKSYDTDTRLKDKLIDKLNSLKDKTDPESLCKKGFIFSTKTFKARDENKNDYIDRFIFFSETPLAFITKDKKQIFDPARKIKISNDFKLSIKEKNQLKKISENKKSDDKKPGENTLYIPHSKKLKFIIKDKNPLAKDEVTIIYKKQEKKKVKKIRGVKDMDQFNKIYFYEQKSTNQYILTYKQIYDFKERKILHKYEVAAILRKSKKKANDNKKNKKSPIYIPALDIFTPADIFFKKNSMESKKDTHLVSLKYTAADRWGIQPEQKQKISIQYNLAD